MTSPELISAVSVLIAALAFWSGVNAWKREFVGKRQIELAENVLALFYEAQDAMRELRSPFSFVGEGKSRERSKPEREEESELLDRAYVVFERYQKREKLFSELRSLRYRCMASFGPRAAEPFDDIFNILNSIFSSARMLGTHYWPRQGRVEMSENEFQKHLKKMQEHEAVFWYMGDENDKITPRVDRAIRKIEKISKSVILTYSGRSSALWRRIVRWLGRP